MFIRSIEDRIPIRGCEAFQPQGTAITISGSQTFQQEFIFSFQVQLSQLQIAVLCPPLTNTTCFTIASPKAPINYSTYQCPYSISHDIRYAPSSTGNEVLMDLVRKSKQHAKNYADEEKDAFGAAGMKTEKGPTH